eukprot:575895-Pleurochrysis_carterae.AAC.2
MRQPSSEDEILTITGLCANDDEMRLEINGDEVELTLAARGRARRGPFRQSAEMQSRVCKVTK